MSVIFRQTSITKFDAIPRCVSRVVKYGRTSRQILEHCKNINCCNISLWTRQKHITWMNFSALVKGILNNEKAWYSNDVLIHWPRKKWTDSGSSFVNNNKVFISDLTVARNKKKDVNNIKRERSPIQIYALQFREPLSHGRIHTPLFFLFAELRIWNVILLPATNHINGMFDDSHAMTVSYLM